ncbi:hypothetical protein [Nonomuraea lactucae]|uniref:hypothetical protein n=1 Tax=Nonomuraea lactucae TaxID=2249762 RepID=UPI001F052962|nr:hypothetical protein [Nonomuraea lactucae]
MLEALAELRRDAPLVHGMAVTAVEVPADGVVTGGGDGALCVFGADGRLRRRWAAHVSQNGTGSSVTGLVIVGDLMVSAGDSSIAVSDRRSGDVRSRLTLEYSVGRIAVAPDGEHLAWIRRSPEGVALGRLSGDEVVPAREFPSPYGVAWDVCFDPTDAAFTSATARAAWPPSTRRPARWSETGSHPRIHTAAVRSTGSPWHRSAASSLPATATAP